MKTFMCLVVVFSTVGLLVNSSYATLAVTSDPADREIGIGNGSTSGTVLGLNLIDIGRSEMRAGNNNPNFGQQDMAVVLVFELPALPSGEAIVSADLTSDVWRHFSDDNADLYGVRSDVSRAVMTSDHGFGDTGSGTLLQGNVYTTAITAAIWTSQSTDSSGDAALATWLDNQYTAVGAGGYAFLRIQLNAEASLGRYYKVPSGDNASGLKLPTLSITTAVVSVPEPSAFLMVGLVSLVICTLKKKRTDNTV